MENRCSRCNALTSDGREVCECGQSLAGGSFSAVRLVKNVPFGILAGTLNGFFLCILVFLFHPHPPLAVMGLAFLAGIVLTTLASTMIDARRHRPIVVLGGASLAVAFSLAILGVVGNRLGFW